MSQTDNQEEWRPISGWLGYEVSDFGRVRSWKWPQKNRQWVENKDREPRVLSPDIRNGYPSVLLSDVTTGKLHKNVGVLVLETFAGIRPVGAQCAHNDGNKNNNRISNLRWATPAENNADKKKHGTHQRGSLIGSARLSEIDAAKIVEMRRSKIRVSDIAARFGVCRNTITNITTGRTWRHVGQA